MNVLFVKPNMITGTPGDAMEPLVFAVLSALTPPHVQRRLCDERIEPIPFDAPVDLVALTVDVFTARRAYQVAAVFRERGVPVVMGGFHPSLCPDEAGRHADCVVVGDAEDTWPRLLRDAQRGNLQSRYVSALPEPSGLAPDRTIFQGKSYAPVHLVEMNRGCPFACEFCSIRAMYRGHVRKRNMSDVLRDIDARGRKHVFFVDDNLYADHAAFEALVDALADRQVPWTCQISMDVARTPDLPARMAKAGCSCVLFGFESLNRDNLEQMNKTWMHTDYVRAIRVFQDAGIMVYGTFIMGYDHDDTNVFDDALAFSTDNRLLLANFNPLMPMPGTPLYQRLEAEERLLFDRWWLDDAFRWGACTFRPRHMSPPDLTDGCRRVRRQFNATRSIVRRFPGVRLRKTTLYKAGLFVAANLLSRKELWRKYGQPLGDPALSLPVATHPPGYCHLASDRTEQTEQSERTCHSEPVEESLG